MFLCLTSGILFLKNICVSSCGNKRENNDSASQGGRIINY